MAELIGSLPQYYDSDFARKDKSDLWGAFTSRFNTPKPDSKGFCFLDGYRDNSRNPAEPSPENNCYFKLPFNYHASNVRDSDCPELDGRQLTVEEVRQIVLTFIDSFFWDNDNYFATSCASTYCVFYGIHVPIILFALGEGGDGKGLFDILETTMLGAENAVALDPNIFTDDNEWRTSAHFGVHKRRVCFKECKGNTKCFNLDVWKRFVVGEELIVRANFGFSTQVCYKPMKKQQSCQFDDVPPMKNLAHGAKPAAATEDEKPEGAKTSHKKATDSFARRVLGAAVGKAQLVSSAEMVNHDEGRFLKGDSHSLEKILASPVAHHIYFREILEPTWNEYESPAEAARILDPETVDDTLQNSTQWLFQKLCGLTTRARPSGYRGDKQGTAAEEPKAEDMTLYISCIQALWRASNVSERAHLGNYLQAGRGRRIGMWKVEKTLAHLIKAPRSAVCAEFISLHKKCRPLADYLGRLDETTNFFGSRQEYYILYGVEVDRLLRLVEKHSIPMPQFRPSDRWYGGFSEHDPAVLDEFDDDHEAVQAGTDEVCSVADVVHFPDLSEHVNTGADSRQHQLRAYLRLLSTRGHHVDGGGPLRGLARTYMKKCGLGRLYSSGPSLQQITKVARRRALEHIPGGVYELDIHLCFISLLVVAILEALGNNQGLLVSKFPLLVHLKENRSTWVLFLQEYFDCDKDAAKKLILSIMSPNDRQTPDAIERPDWLPQLDALQQEIQAAVTLLAERDELFKEVARKRPDASTLHVYLGEQEAAVSLEMMHCLQTHGAIPISLVFGGGLFQAGLSYFCFGCIQR